MNSDEKVYRYYHLIIVCVFILSLFPICAIGWYDVPSADDFSMGLQAGVEFRRSSNVFYTITAGLEKTMYLYKNWNGNYTSAFLAAIPLHTWGEEFYRITPWLSLTVLILGIERLMRSIFGNCLKQDRDTVGIITIITMLIVIQCMPNVNMRVETLFWYSGAANYTVMFGLGSCWVASMIVLFSDMMSKGRTSWKRMVISTILAMLVGGANYMTSLTCAILAILGIIFSLTHHSISKIALLPCSVLLLGFSISCLAPGNRIRGASVGFSGNPVEMIIDSMGKTVMLCINEWTGIAVMILLSLLVPVFWNMAGKTHFQFRYPALFVLSCFLLTSANVAPPLYATGSIDSGRISGLFWMQYALLLVLTEGYMIGWARRMICRDRIIQNNSEKYLIPYLTSMTAAISAVFILFTLSDPMTFTVSNAFEDLYSGKAKHYASQFYDRMEILYDPEESNVVFDHYADQPSILFFSDITKDPNDWTNQAMANYYGKESVVIK